LDHLVSALKAILSLLMNLSFSLVLLPHLKANLSTLLCVSNPLSFLYVLLFIVLIRQGHFHQLFDLPFIHLFHFQWEIFRKF